VPRYWTKGAIGLLGDAAHPVLPFLAQGGVMALEDAVVLADVMHAEGDTARALKIYELLRRPRASRAADASRMNGTIYHLSGLGARARNLALRTLSGEHLMARYDWLYGWRPEDVSRR
jgi:salicylate hydroxylase